MSEDVMARADCFVQESDRMLRIDVDGGVWLRPGAAVAYRGDLRFKRLPTIEAASLLDAAFRELSPIVRAKGTGRLYCGHQGAQVRIIQLHGGTIHVASQDLVAFEDTLTFTAGLVGDGVGIAAGGLITVTLSGHGALAYASHGDPLTLHVTPDDPLSTDPHATIAWSGDLMPALKTDVSWRTLVHRGGREPVQMYFEGSGEVIIQPFEHPLRRSRELAALRRLSALVAG